MSNVLKAAVIGALALLVASCGQRDRHDHRDRQDRMQEQGETTGTQSNDRTAAGERPHLGRACATDIQQYCANEPKRFRCLRDNEDKLSAGCKTAFEQMREFRRQRRMERGNQQGDAGRRHHADDDDDQ